MKLSEKINAVLRDIFSPGAAAFDEKRSRRILILATICGIIVAVLFGLALYHLNKIGRIGR